MTSVAERTAVASRERPKGPDTGAAAQGSTTVGHVERQAERPKGPEAQSGTK
jgi:hypothetical protein